MIKEGLLDSKGRRNEKTPSAWSEEHQGYMYESSVLFPHLKSLSLSLAFVQPFLPSNLIFFCLPFNREKEIEVERTMTKVGVVGFLGFFWPLQCACHKPFVTTRGLPFLSTIVVAFSLRLFRMAAVLS